MSSIARPDEQVLEAETRKAQTRTGQAKSALGLGAGALAGASGLASKVLPFLSEYIPTDLAMKGINKIAPKLGEFLKSGLSQGLSVESGLDYLKEQFKRPEQEPAKEEGNIIKQYSPELSQFIEGEIKKGRSPLEAGAMAQLKPEFKKHIEKLSKDHKSPWSAILETVYGKGDKAEAVKAYNAQKQQKQTMMQQEEERFNQQYTNGGGGSAEQAMMQNQQQQGQGLDPSVAAILQQGQAILQKFKGQA